MEEFRSKSSYPEDETHNNTYSHYYNNSLGGHFDENGDVGFPQNHEKTNPRGMQDLRCYSASYATSNSSYSQQPQNNNGTTTNMDIVVVTNNNNNGMQDQWKFKKGKSTNGVVSKSWSFKDPELQRKKRIASYKVYSVEGKVKGSFKKSFRWIKETYSQMVYGHK